MTFYLLYKPQVAMSMLIWHTLARLSQWNSMDDWYMLCQMSIPFNEMSNIIPGC